MNDVLARLSTIYLASAAGKSGGQRDFIIGYESFLRKAGLDDGDDREIAEQQLRAAEASSDGCLAIDRHRRSGDPQHIRLSKNGGEAWLFALTGRVRPSLAREQLAAFFSTAATCDVPPAWTGPWRAWFEDLARRAGGGASVQPFKAGDPAGNEELLRALVGVINRQGHMLMRYASSEICGDSKTLQLLEPRLCMALTAITGHDTLEAFGILHKPRSVTLHGPLTLSLGGESFDFARLPAPFALFEDNLAFATSISTSALICLTVENEDTFHELARRNTGLLLIHTSFAGSATMRLLRLLPDTLRFYHFGDSDPAGSEILRDLRDRSGHTIHPLLMAHRPRPAARHLRPSDRKTLERLIRNEQVRDLHDFLNQLLESGQVGDFEQEAIPISEVLKAIEALKTSP